MKTVVQDGNGNVIDVEDDGLPEPVPPSISPIQARLALNALGKLGDVEAFIVAAGGEAKIIWEYATVIERHSPFVAGAAQALGMSEEDMDNVFRMAAAL